MTQSARTAPWHLWVVAILSLIWDGYGGYDYLMTQMENRDYLSAMTEPYGLSVDTAIAYYDSFPLWVEFAWGLAIWASVTGALLLALRNRFAYPAFALSLVGLVPAMVWQIVNPMDGLDGAGAAAWIMPAVVTVMLALQTWYARAMAAKGVLR